MAKCEVCGKEEATAWFKMKRVCQRCWRVYKYGDIESYMGRFKNVKRRKK